MLLPIAKPPITYKQKAAALVVAGTIDFLQVTLLPLLGFGYVLDDFLDVIAAVILMAICGFKWQFILAFLVELIPALDLFPTWTAVVLLLPTQQPQPTAGSVGVTPSTNVKTPPAVNGFVEVNATVIPPVVASPRTTP